MENKLFMVFDSIIVKDFNVLFIFVLIYYLVFIDMFNVLIMIIILCPTITEKTRITRVTLN